MSVDIIHGDCLAILKTLPTESVHCVVTSPPYWGLRDYGVDGQIGLEGSLAEHIDMLVAVFDETRRVLRKDGTLWLNYGDAYASAPNGRSAADTKTAGNDDRTFRDKPCSTIGGVLKAKDRMLLPARVAIALQESGWWVRDEIIWHKPNPMPISVRDRTTPAHEMMYMLSKSARYYYDQEAIKEPIAAASKKRYAQETLNTQMGGFKQDQYESGITGQRSRSRRPAEILKTLAGSETRNRRSVWSIGTKPFAEAHFATFPPDLIRPCIIAGCPEGGTVLDPFFGAGTTGLVALELGRHCIGIELSEPYIEIARKRLGLDYGIFA
jgi:DNA modification methylase